MQTLATPPPTSLSPWSGTSINPSCNRFRRCQMADVSFHIKLEGTWKSEGGLQLAHPAFLRDDVLERESSHPLASDVQKNRTPESQIPNHRNTPAPIKDFMIQNRRRKGRWRGRRKDENQTKSGHENVLNVVRDCPPPNRFSLCAFWWNSEQIFV